MTSLGDQSARFLARFEGLEVPDWTDPSDLTRLSLEAVARDQVLGRDLPSTGRVRLTGPAVGENSARLDSAGDVLVKVQKLVTALGASIEGFKSQVGVLADRVRARTQLRLVAGSAPGSVQLFVVPEMPPAAELYPGGHVPLVDEDQTLIDRSAEALLDLLELASVPLPDARDMTDRLNSWGPRVATSVRNLSSAVVDTGIEVEWSWAVPNGGRRVAKLSTAGAQWFGEVVAGRNLDVEEVTIRGVLHTISDTTAWEMRTEGGERIRLKHGDIPASTVSALHVGQRVMVVATVEVVLLPGGTERADYTALTVTSLSESDQPFA